MTSRAMQLRCESRQRILLLGALLLLALAPSAGRAAEDRSEEYSVKAALVYNFARFTEWPDAAFAENSETIRIVVFGGANLSAAFATIDGKRAADRRIEVIHTDNPEDVVGCHLLFLAKTKREQWPQIVAALAQDPVLTIGEMNGFLDSGGIMNLHVVNNKIRFQVNLDQAQSRDLLISSRILKLASTVIDEKKDED